MIDVIQNWLSSHFDACIHLTNFYSVSIDTLDFIHGALRYSVNLIFQFGQTPDLIIRSSDMDPLINSIHTALDYRAGPAPVLGHTFV